VCLRHFVDLSASSHRLIRRLLDSEDMLKIELLRTSAVIIQPTHAPGRRGLGFDLALESGLLSYDLGHLYSLMGFRSCQLGPTSPSLSIRTSNSIDCITSLRILFSSLQAFFGAE